MNRVCLDHHIRRQGIRYYKDDAEFKKRKSSNFNDADNDRRIRYADINGDWFSNIRKPDFQRETNAWTPEQCVKFLESVVRGRIIPSIILWESEESGRIFVLDGAHRLSVIRAWMVNDWGDREDKYYERKDKEKVSLTATKTRELVKNTIGSFKNFEEAFNEREALIDNDESPKSKMTEWRYLQATFYAKAFLSNKSLYAQWVVGDYESAEQSFLSINRQGQALDPWEANLIEYRKGSYSRSIMSIANGGEPGHYWPENNLENDSIQIVSSLPEIAEKIYKKLFVPPFKIPIRELTVPLMVAPAYFQKHKYLLEVVPLIVYSKIALDVEKQMQLLKRDYKGEQSEVINNANYLLTTLDSHLENIVSIENSSKSLSIVPLFYWYNQRGQYNRALFYGFMFWLLSGTENDIKQRKLLFTLVRGNFEHAIFTYKKDISDFLILGGSGAGLKSTKQTAGFFQNLLEGLLKNIELEKESEELETLFFVALNASKKSRKKTAKSSRNVSSRDKTQVNIREMFKASTRCYLCGGIVNLSYGGIQYDHVEDYAKTQQTDLDEIMPTHPYCNRHKDELLSLREGKKQINLPDFVSKSTKDSLFEESKKVQLKFNFWGENENFPK